MIRTGYLRWEIEAGDRPCAQDRFAREIYFLARPTFRRVRIHGLGPFARIVAERFERGQATLAEWERAKSRQHEVVEESVPDVGPHLFRYSQRDSVCTPAWWMGKVRSEARVFASNVVRAASSIPQLVVSSRALRLGYTRLVEWETLRVIEGKSRPQPTRDDEPITIHQQEFEATGIPELVAADLVRDVFTPAEFDEFRHEDRVTLRSGGRIYRISRRTHAMIDVWDEKDGRPVARLCVVFEDPGMPPSDEVVMKYLLARHEPKLLWDIANPFPGPPKRFEDALVS